VTLLLVTIGLLWSAAKHDTDLAEKGLILVRVLMTVIYGHVIHSLRSVTTHRQHATFTEHLAELAARLTELAALPGSVVQLRQMIGAQVHAAVQQEMQAALAAHSEQYRTVPHSTHPKLSVVEAHSEQHTEHEQYRK
jgi:hypothetical protein